MLSVRTTGKSFVFGIITALLCGAAAGVSAQQYPIKPVKIVVGFEPGGTNDILARVVAASLNKRLGQAFIVENRPGAASTIGTEYVAKSKPDGYTLLVSSSGGLTVSPFVYPNIGYDPVKDFEPVALLGTFPLVIAVNPNIPVNNIAELISYAKAQGGSVNHGVASTSFQLAAELFANSAGIKLVHIPYKGSNPILLALLGGHIEVGLLDTPVVMSQRKAGKVKALAVTTANRSSALPDVPTVAESGVPGYDVTIWTGLMAPKGVPARVLEVLRPAVAETLANKEVLADFASLGMEPGNTDGPGVTRRIVSDMEKYRKVANSMSFKPY